MIGIYKITSPTGRIYIGQSVNIKRRWSQYLKCDDKFNKSVSYSVKLFRSFLKYGAINHTYEVIEHCLVDSLNDRERYWQDFYNAASPKNLNCILTDTKTKKRECRPMSDERKEDISRVHKGKVYSEETRAKIRAARSKQVITKEHRQAISDNSGSAREVLNVITGVIYPSAKKAALAHGVKPNTLVGNLIGKAVGKLPLIYITK